MRALYALLPDQQGDDPQTWASIAKAHDLLGYAPKTPLRIGLERFASWLTAVRAAPVGGGKADFFGQGVIPARIVPPTSLSSARSVP